MGPITLFDKSFLQSLSLDEAVWFDTFFLTNIPPIFFVETLADLEKAVRAGRTPEQEVGIIADKTPERHSSPNVFHTQICTDNLMGSDVPMDGRILSAGGKAVKTADQSGIVYDLSPEAEAFSRWQKGEFLEVERQYAKLWRRMLRSLNFEETLKRLNYIGINPSSCKTLEEAKSIAESIVNTSDDPFNRMKFVFSVLGIPEQYFLKVFERWNIKGYPPLKSFASYAAYMVVVETFFYIAASANLISQKKVTNKIDLAYLFYLPFCMVFVSSDRFHRRCAPLFLRDDQDFIWGPDLKADLLKIDQYYERLPESEKEKGLYAIANCPPSDGDFLVSSLWDRFLPRWRSLPKKSPPRQDQESKQLVQHIEKFTEAKPLRSDQVDFDLLNPDAVVLQRRVRKRKGKWWQLPKDLEVKAEENG